MGPPPTRLVHRTVPRRMIVVAGIAFRSIASSTSAVVIWRKAFSVNRMESPPGPEMATVAR